MKQEIPPRKDIQEDVDVVEATIETTTPVINTERNTSEVLNKNDIKEIVKEGKVVNAEKEKNLKERFLSFFKSKNIAEITDPVKLNEMVKKDCSELAKISLNTGLGSTVDVSAQYREFLEKYNLENDSRAIELSKELQTLKKELSGMQPSVEKREKNDRRIALHKEFTGMLHSQVVKRIQEIGSIAA